jgi:ADP-heptose:LPS heptosyltransferase
MNAPKDSLALAAGTGASELSRVLEEVASINDVNRSLAEELADTTHQLRKVVGDTQVRYLGLVMDEFVYGNAQRRVAFLVRAAAAVKRRARARFARGQVNTPGQLLRLVPALRYPNATPRIAVLGVGGLGDILDMTPLLDALSARFPSCELYALHTNPLVREILGPWALLSGVFVLPHSARDGFIEHFSKTDHFDMIVDFRYVAHCIRCVGSRVPEDFFEAADDAIRPWLKYLTIWPAMINTLEREAHASGHNVYSLMGATSGLSIGIEPPLHFVPPPSAFSILTSIPERPYVTVHNGIDRNMDEYMEGRPATKMLPLITWEAIVSRLRSRGIAVYQLGVSGETPIRGADHRLLGRTSVSQAAAVLQHAAVHIDTEGGLVRLARAVHAPSVVLFGPTSVPFHGFPSNVNMAAGGCANCWWSCDDWLSECPRGTSGPACMTAHDPSDVVARCEELVARLNRNPPKIGCGHSSTLIAQPAGARVSSSNVAVWHGASGDSLERARGELAIALISQRYVQQRLVETRHEIAAMAGSRRLELARQLAELRRSRGTMVWKRVGRIMAEASRGFATIARHLADWDLLHVHRSTDVPFRCRRAARYQSPMDIHPDSGWYKPPFTHVYGGFFPRNSDRRARQIMEFTSTDLVRRDMLILQMRTVIDEEVEGDFAEVGVYRGATAKLIHHYAPERHLHLFDTFSGFDRRDLALEMGIEREKAKEQFKNVTVADMLHHVSPVNENIHVHPGLFPDSFPLELRDRQFAFVHLDLDLYEPTIAGLRLFYERMPRGGIIVVHDFNAWFGARQAVDDFFRDKPEIPIAMPDKSGSAVIVKQ